MPVSMTVSGEVSALITPYWPADNMNEDAMATLSGRLLDKSTAEQTRADGLRSLIDDAGSIGTGSTVDAFIEAKTNDLNAAEAAAAKLANQASGAAMAAQNIFNTKNLLNSIGIDGQAKLDASTAAAMGSAATGNAAGALSFEAIKAQISAQVQAATQMVAGGFAAANQQLNQNIQAGTAVSAAPALMPPALSQGLNGAAGWGAVPGMPSQFAGSGFYGNYDTSAYGSMGMTGMGNPMMSGMENMGGAGVSYGAGAFGNAGMSAGTYMGTGASYDPSQPGSLINTLINNAPAVATLAQTGMAVGNQAFQHLQQAAAVVTAGFGGALGAYDDGSTPGTGLTSGDVTGAINSAESSAHSAVSSAADSARGAVPASLSTGSGASAGTSTGVSPAAPEADSTQDSASDAEATREVEEREKATAEALSSGPDSTEENTPAEDEPADKEQEPAEPEPAPEPEVAAEVVDPPEDSAPATPNAGGTAPTTTSISADYSVSAGPDGIDGDVSTSLTSASPEASPDVATHTTSAAHDVATHTTAATAPAAAVPATAGVPSAPAPAGMSGFIAPTSGLAETARPTTPAATGPDPEADRVLDTFGRTTRRAIRQLATAADAYGEVPMALAVLSPGRSVLVTADFFGFPSRTTGALPSGVIPLTAVDGIPESFFAAWIGAADPAYVLAEAARAGYIDPQTIVAVDRDPERLLPEGVEVISRALLDRVTGLPAAANLLDHVVGVPESTDLPGLITHLAAAWKLPLEADLTAAEMAEAAVHRRWLARRGDEVLPASVWWLILSATDALVAGDLTYARAALAAVLALPTPQVAVV